jgi:hypothetical protein
MASELGHVTGPDGTTLHVGVENGEIALYVGAWLSADGVSLGLPEAEELAQLLVRAGWTAGEQCADLARQHYEAMGGGDDG